MRSFVIAIAIAASGCTLGLEQKFDLSPGPAVTDGAADTWFELTNRGGNAAEPMSVYRIEIDDQPVGGGLFARNDDGDARIEMVQDGGTPGVVDPGDVVRVIEYDHGKNLAASQNGTIVWVNVMVLEPDQRSSDALTRTWGTVWQAKWHVGS